jgi:hypothetical protein
MKHLFNLLFILFSIQSIAQVGFTNTYGAFGLFNEAKDIAVDTSGHVFLCGSSGGLGAQNGDLLIIKTDSIGIQQWSKVYGNENSESGKAISLFSDGSLVAIGNTNSGNNNDYDVSILRADSEGEVLWDTIIGLASWDQAADITVLHDGGFAVAVNEWGNSGSENSIACYKFSSENALEWVYRPPSENYAQANAILELSDSSIIIGGAGIEGNELDNDMLLIKLDYSGLEQWIRYYGEERREWIAGLTLTDDNRIGVAGNRIIDGNNTSPQLLSLDVDGEILDQFFDPNFAEVTSVSYSSFTNSYFFSWNFVNSNATEKTAIFNFTNSFVFRCAAILPGNAFYEQYGNATAIGVNGQMHLAGSMQESGPGITSFLSFKCGDFCQHNQTLAVDINETQNRLSALLYPNPSSGLAYLKLSSNEEISEIMLYNVSGKPSKVAFSKHQKTIRLDLLEKKPGFYYLKVICKKSSTLKESLPIPIIITN